MPKLNRARHPVDKSSVRWWDAEWVGSEGWIELLQARGATCVASPTSKRGVRGSRGWLQASILGFSQSCEERDSLGSKARCDHAGHNIPADCSLGTGSTCLSFGRVNHQEQHTVWNENVGRNVANVVVQEREPWPDRTIHEIIVVEKGWSSAGSLTSDFGVISSLIDQVWYISNT